MERRKNLGVKKKSINKNKIRNKNNKLSINFRNIVPAIVDYLKSDSYFYSHFISSSPSDYSAPFEGFLASTGKPILANEDSLKQRLVQYLYSDMYLYAPLEGTQHGDGIAVRTAIAPPRGQELQFMRVTSRVISEKIAWQTNKMAEIPVVEKRGDHGSKSVPHDVSVISPQTPALQEVKKPTARRSSRLSTLTG